eukprot:6854422-Pyramimonas_sp.AAC.1
MPPSTHRRAAYRPVDHQLPASRSIVPREHSQSRLHIGDHHPPTSRPTDQVVDRRPTDYHRANHRLPGTS